MWKVYYKIYNTWFLDSVYKNGSSAHTRVEALKLCGRETLVIVE